MRSANRTSTAGRTPSRWPLTLSLNMKNLNKIRLVALLGLLALLVPCLAGCTGACDEGARYGVGKVQVDYEVTQLPGGVTPASRQGAELVARWIEAAWGTKFVTYSDSKPVREEAGQFIIHIYRKDQSCWTCFGVAEVRIRYKQFHDVYATISWSESLGLLKVCWGADGMLPPAMFGEIHDLAKSEGIIME